MAGTRVLRIANKSKPVVRATQGRLTGSTPAPTFRKEYKEMIALIIIYILLGELALVSICLNAVAIFVSEGWNRALYIFVFIVNLATIHLLVYALLSELPSVI